LQAAFSFLGEAMHRKKKAEETALRENLLTNTNAIQQTPEEKLISDRNQKFIQQADSGTDVGSIDMLKPFLDLYNRASADQQNQRTSTGILNLAQKSANPNQAAAYNAYLNSKRQQDAAGQLENAYNAADAQATGNLFNLAQLANSRNLGKAGASAQAYNTYMQNKGPSLFDKIMGIGKLVIGGAQAYTSGGGKF
jgi:hypothetical protein